MNRTPDKPSIIVICGPTGIGKTSVAIEIAERFKGEIIGADSMQIYRHMDIGTAKPTAEEQARIAHHMIDIVEPDMNFNALQYARLARDTALQLHSRGIIPFVVGGTGLYIKSFLHGMFQCEPIDAQIRKRLKEEATRHGSHYLHQRLQEYDPETAKKLHSNDTHRIIRALETFEATGKTISEYHRHHGFTEEPFNVLKIGLNMDRVRLYERINKRVDAMINAGLVAEVKRLLNMGFTGKLKSMQSIGYRHTVDFIDGRFTWEECVRTLKRDHRRYAKRQLTWFRADAEIIWKDPRQVKQIMKTVKEFLKES